MTVLLRWLSILLEHAWVDFHNFSKGRGLVPLNTHLREAFRSWYSTSFVCKWLCYHILAWFYFIYEAIDGFVWPNKATNILLRTLCYGFRKWKNHSCEANFITSITKIASLLDQLQVVQTDALSLHVAWTFIGWLLYGISGDWTKKFLTKRSQDAGLLIARW